MKKLLIVTGAIIALVVVVLGVVPMFVNAERFRPMVESKAREALGRNVTIGKLDFSLLRGAVVADDLTVADDPHFSNQPFLTAKELRIGVEVLPLITSQQANVKGIVLEEPQINLIARNGKWNYESLGASPAPAASETPVPRGRKNAPLEQPQARPAAASQKFNIAEVKIFNGTLIVRQAAGQAHEYRNIQGQVSDLAPKSVSPFNFSAETPGGGHLEASGTVGPLDMGNLSASPLDATVKAQGLDVAQTGFAPPSSGIAGLVDFDGKLKSDGKTLDSTGKVTANRLRLVKGGQPSREPVTLDYASQMDVAEHRGTISRGDITFGRSIAHLTGSFAQKGAATMLNARLKGDNLPIDSVEGLLPAIGVVLPQGTKLQGGSVSTDLGITGPLDALVTSGPVNVVNSKVEGFNLKSHASALSQFAGLPSANDLIIQALSSKLRVAPDGLRADGIDLIVPGLGTVTGEGLIAANNALNFKMKAKLANANLLGGISQLASFGQSKGELPFLIQGTTSNPIFLPDVGAAMSNTMKGTLNAPVKGTQGLGNVLGGLFGKKPK